LPEDSKTSHFDEGYLKDCGFELDVAENGKIAVEKVISGSPNLVLMDVQMPVMDGLKPLAAIRQWEAKVMHIRYPSSALTAHAGQRQSTRAGKLVVRSTLQTDQEGNSSGGHFPHIGGKSISLPEGDEAWFQPTWHTVGGHDEILAGNGLQKSCFLIGLVRCSYNQLPALVDCLCRGVAVNARMGIDMHDFSLPIGEWREVASSPSSLAFAHP